MSAATETTSRFVEVPIVVPMPPTMVAKPMGIKTELAGMPVRRDTLIRIGISRTTMGTLLMKALAAAPTRRVRSSDKLGLLTQTRARKCPTGSSAPVRTSPLPAIISAQTAIRAS